MSTKPLSPDVARACSAINALSTKLEHTQKKAEQYQVSIGQHIEAIKKAQPKKWQQIIAKECRIKKTRAYELLRIARGNKTAEQIRGDANRRKIKHRLSVPERKNSAAASSKPPAVVPAPARAAGARAPESALARVDAAAAPVAPVQQVEVVPVVTENEPAGAAAAAPVKQPGPSPVPVTAPVDAVAPTSTPQGEMAADTVATSSKVTTEMEPTKVITDPRSERAADNPIWKAWGKASVEQRREFVLQLIEDIDKLVLEDDGVDVDLSREARDLFKARPINDTTVATPEDLGVTPTPTETTTTTNASVQS